MAAASDCDDGQQMSDDGIVRINMWSTPRACSTALLYSFNQRPDCTAVDEPLYAHHMTQCPHLGKNRPYLKELLASQESDGNALVRGVMLGPLKEAGHKVLFIKHMAKHIVKLDTSAFLKRTHNMLLIRQPVDMLSSWAEKMDASFEETGYADLMTLAVLIERETGRPPIVVDSDALQRDPEGVLRELCARVGIEFCPEQLSWPPGPKECDGMWASYWYANVHKSTGFNSLEDKARLHTYRRFPPVIFRLLRHCQPFYDALAVHAIRPSSQSSSGATSTTTDHGLLQPLAPDAANMDILVWVGDRLLPREMAKVSVFDSIVQGGDAVWEGLRIYDGRVFHLERHLQRLMDSAKAMDFKGVPPKDDVRRALFTTLAANGMRDGVHVRLTLSRGLKTTSSMNPHFNAYGCCLIVLPEHKPVGGAATYDNNAGISLITSAIRRNPPQCLDSKIHHNNLINNILAKIQANHAKAADAIMLDVEGNVSETNATNIFMVKHGTVVTPHADHCLPGITRQTVMDLCRALSIPLEERRVSLAEFYAADEAFTTGTMGELTPVASIDGRAIGSGPDGWPITRRIQREYRALTEREGEPLPF